MRSHELLEKWGRMTTLKERLPQMVGLNERMVPVGHDTTFKEFWLLLVVMIFYDDGENDDDDHHHRQYSSM